jgi:hypothetical protein
MAINLQNIQWKLHVDESTVGDPHQWFKAFAPWIPDSPEVFVDVADYSHVEDGPVVFLSGHAVCYSLDATGRRHGLLYERRQPAEGANAEKLLESLTALLKHASLLETDPEFPVKPKFLVHDLKFIINNRAIAPNNDETLAAVKPELEALLNKVYGAGGFTLTREADKRQRFMVHIKANAPVTVNEALKKLE